MKKSIKVITIAAVIIAAMILGMKAAYNAGIQHAITDSVIFTVDCYDPDNPDDSAWNGYDQLIYITLDNVIYEHGMYQG